MEEVLGLGLRSELYAQLLDTPAETIKNSLLTGIELNQDIKLIDLLSPVLNDPNNYWRHRFSQTTNIKDVEQWIYQNKTLLSWRISETLNFTKGVAEIIAAFIYPESDEATRFNIVFVGSRNQDERSTKNRYFEFLASWLYAWEASEKDFRNNNSTYVCVRSKSSLTPRNKKAMWRLRPAGIDKKGSQTYWIQQVGSRAPGKKPGGYLHARESGRRDYRDCNSTRLCVQDDVDYTQSLFRIIMDITGYCRIQMVGRRKRTAPKGPSLHVWDCTPRVDARDSDSTNVCVHDNFYNLQSLWRLDVAQ